MVPVERGKPYLEAPVYILPGCWVLSTGEVGIPTQWTTVYSGWLYTEIRLLKTFVGYKMQLFFISSHVFKDFIIIVCTEILFLNGPRPYTVDKLYVANNFNQIR